MKLPQKTIGAESVLEFQRKMEIVDFLKLEADANSAHELIKNATFAQKVKILCWYFVKGEFYIRLKYYIRREKNSANNKKQNKKPKLTDNSSPSTSTPFTYEGIITQKNKSTINKNIQFTYLVRKFPNILYLDVKYGEILKHMKHLQELPADDALYRNLTAGSIPVKINEDDYNTFIAQIQSQRQAREDKELLTKNTKR